MIKTTVAVLALTALPGLAIAQCSGSHSQQASMSCAEGMTYDAETNTCVPVVTG